ncbi:bpX6 domain-containing protein [Pseudomonas fluorescens]|uniref:bpX6 domain-containing protein n=1 Tax=Pseudomonas fluorescens TaxID=294 RepID=UPI0007D06DBB|nr:bpX6 domain-containing protein [Pseudomonas fluorescens]
MLEHAAALIRRPVLSGHQRIEGLWFSAERFAQHERERLIIEHWQTAASAYRFADGDLLRFALPLTVQCETLLGWPLIRQGKVLCSAVLDPQEMRDLPAADLWLVRGSHVSALHLRDAEVLAPGEWIDISGVTLLDTYDCRNILPPPVLEPLEVASDVREILGKNLKPVSPEQQKTLQALIARQQKAPQASPDAVVSPASVGGTVPDAKTLPWLKLSVTLVLLVAVFWMGAQGRHTDVNAVTPAPVTSLSLQIGAVVVGTLIAGVALTLLLFGLRHLLRRVASVPLPLPGAPTHSPADIAPRARPLQHKPALWRRWVTRLTRHSRLSALYGRRQAAYMQRMFEMFENGDYEEALRHAIPLGGGEHSGEQSFGTPQRRQDLSISQHQGLARSIVFEQDVEGHLRQIYRQTFQRLDREGRIEEAVFVLAELLKVQQEALDYLEKHGRQQQAADLALAWDMPAATIVRLLCLAGNWQRALLVARRDEAFADAVALLQDKSPLYAERLRLEWAESLARKGLWLQAVEVVWPLPAERERATQWLLNAEMAGGSLALGALVKRAILLPDTLLAYADQVEQLRDDPARYAERAVLAESLLQHKAHASQLAWLASATVHAIIADQVGGQGRLSLLQLQALVSMSKDKLLQADLPQQLPARPAPYTQVTGSEPLQWTAPAMGSRMIRDAVPLDDQRYLLALGEAGAVVVDAHGNTLYQFAMPAQYIVLAHGRQVALLVARRNEVWRISKVDLVTRIATDLGVQMFNVFSRTFNGSNWTIGRGRQLRVVDVDRGFETLWHVSDLPGEVIGMKDDTYNESLWLSDAQAGLELWHYRLPERRLMKRMPVPAVGIDQQYLLSADGRLEFMRVGRENDEVSVLVFGGGTDCNNYSLPDCDFEQDHEELVEVHLQEHCRLIGYLINDHDMRWHFIARTSNRLVATLQWPRHGVRVRCVGSDFLLFDDQGRLSHFNMDNVTQHNLSLN